MCGASMVNWKGPGEPLIVGHYTGTPPIRKIDFFRALPKLPPPSPQFGQVVQLFLDVKNDVFVRITEPSNDDYDNDVSDNCDHTFGTFDDLGVKNDQKVSHNMILMSKYKGQHGGKRVKKSGKALPRWAGVANNHHCHCILKC